MILLSKAIVRLYLADKAVGAKGFKATWTEIKVKVVIKINKVEHILNVSF